MSDLSQRLANLSPAKRELLLLQLKKKKGGIHRRDFDKLRRIEPVEINPADFFSIQHAGMTVEEMKTEAVLDPGIYPEAAIPPTPLFKGGKGGFEHVREPSAIFLTGATGFVGAFLLCQLPRPEGRGLPFQLSCYGRKQHGRL